MKKDISFDTEMENGYKEQYKKKDISCKKKQKHGSANIKQNRVKSKQVTKDNEEPYILIKDSKEQGDQTVTDRCT